MLFNAAVAGGLGFVLRRADGLADVGVDRQKRIHEEIRLTKKISILECEPHSRLPSRIGRRDCCFGCK